MVWEEAGPPPLPQGKQIKISMYRRLGGLLRPGNLNGSCVRDCVAGVYSLISPPGGRGRVPLWFGA